MPSRPSKRITALTRHKITDQIELRQTAWSGRLPEVDFLLRIYRLDEMPSNDRRYSDAGGDITQHREWNKDWEDYWVFTDSRFELQSDDKKFLDFLAEMLHPILRRSTEETEQLLDIFNNALAPDGYEIAVTGDMSGHPTYAGREKTSYHGTNPKLILAQWPVLTDPKVLQQHLGRIRANVVNDPSAAIGSCKELIESLCKVILIGQGSTEEEANKPDLPALYGRVAALLGTRDSSVPGSVKASQYVHSLLNQLVQKLGELRNELGSGHGKGAVSPALPMHARLVLGMTVTIAEIILELWQNQVNAGRLPAPF